MQKPSFCSVRCKDSIFWKKNKTKIAAPFLGKKQMQCQHALSPSLSTFMWNAQPELGDQSKKNSSFWIHDTL